MRVICYIAGPITCSIGVTFFFCTYFPPEVYELLVKEFSQKYGAPIGKAKTIYDCCSWLIGRISRFPEANFTFKDALSLRQKV